MTSYPAVTQRLLLCLLLLILGGCQTTYHLTGAGVSASDLEFLDDIRASRHLIVQVSGNHLDGNITLDTPFNQHLEEALTGSGVFRSVTIASAFTLPELTAANDDNPLIVNVLMNNRYQRKEGVFLDILTSPVMLIYFGAMVDAVRLGVADANASFFPVGTLVGISLAVLIPQRESFMLDSRVQLNKEGSRQAESLQQDKLLYNRGVAARLYGQRSNVVQQNSAQRTALQVIQLLREQGEI